MIDEPQKKKRVNSKKKGSNFEGHVCKLLEAALSPMKFRRSQSSGAILGGQNEKFMEHFSADAKALFIGDVVPTNETDVIRSDKWKLRFTIECKFYKTPDHLEHLLSNTKIRYWFNQATVDSLKINKLPLLIFKFNHTEIFAAISSDTTPLPATVTKGMTLFYPANDELPAQRFTILLLKEVLQDLKWWKDDVNS